MKDIPEKKIIFPQSFFVSKWFIYNNQSIDNKTKCNHRELCEIQKMKKDSLSCINKDRN